MMDIVVEDALMGSVAGFIKGYIVVEGLRARFEGVAYGRFGGQNVSIKFSSKAKHAMKQRGLDPDEVAQHAQHLIVQGTFRIAPSAKPRREDGLQ